MAESWRRRELELESSLEEEEDEAPLQRHSRKPDPPSPRPEKRRLVRKVYEKKKKAMLTASLSPALAEHSAFRSQVPSLTRTPAIAPQAAESSPQPKVPPSSPVFTTYNRKLEKRKRDAATKSPATTAASKENLLSPEDFSVIIQQVNLQAKLIAQEYESRAIAAAALQEEVAETKRAEEQRRKEQVEEEKRRKKEAEQKKRKLAPAEPAQAPSEQQSPQDHAPALRAQDHTETLAIVQSSKPTSPAQAPSPLTPTEEEQLEDETRGQIPEDDGIMREEEARQLSPDQLQNSKARQEDHAAAEPPQAPVPTRKTLIVRLDRLRKRTLCCERKLSSRAGPLPTFITEAVNYYR